MAKPQRRGINRVQVLAITEPQEAGDRPQPTHRHLHLPQPGRVPEPDGPHGVELAGPAAARPRCHPPLAVQGREGPEPVPAVRQPANLPGLASLGLGDCTGCGVTNSGLLLLARSLPRLAALSLRSCWQLSDAGLAHLTHLHAGGAEVPVLANLYLQDGQKSTNLYTHYISQGLHITALDLNFCADISDSG